MILLMTQSLTAWKLIYISPIKSKHLLHRYFYSYKKSSRLGAPFRL